MRQDFKTHPKRDFPAGVGTFSELSSMEEGSRKLDWEAKSGWGEVGDLAAGLGSAILVSCWPVERQLISSPVKCLLESDPISAQPVSFVGVCKCDT